MSSTAVERARVSSELRAGRAVAAGALLAGPLSKRSEWLHTWNKRFCVLTTEELSWHRDSGGAAEAVSDSRVLRMHSKVHLIAKDGVLCITPGSAPAAMAAPLWFSAASEPELRVWHRTLRALIDSLDAAARIARVHIHENGSRFSAAPFTELPHAGSRNLREGRLAKPFFVCGREPQRGMPPRSVNNSAVSGANRSSASAASAAAAAAASAASPAGAAGGGGIVVAGVAGDVVLYLFSLPPATAGWNGEQRRAFRELMAAASACGSPRLLPTVRSPLEASTRPSIRAFHTSLPRPSTRASHEPEGFGGLRKSSEGFRWQHDAGRVVLNARARMHARALLPAAHAQPRCTRAAKMAADPSRRDERLSLAGPRRCAP